MEIMSGFFEGSNSILSSIGFDYRFFDFFRTTAAYPHLARYFLFQLGNINRLAFHQPFELPTVTILTAGE
jgi:hypothetical protein